MREERLPPGWAWTTIGTSVEILDNQRVPINAEERDERIKDKAPSELYPYFGATGQVGWIDEYIFGEELVLLGEDGAPFLESIKAKAYLAKGKYWVNNHAHVLRALPDLALNAFVMHYLNVFDYHGFVTGTTRLKLNQAQMRNIPLPLAPLAEQRRIVAKIEELFTRLDAGVKALKRVQAAVKRYKASVLKAACEGRLVPQDPNDEPAAKLLARILAERRAKWEADLRAKGKDPSKAKYEEPRPPDTDSLPELLDGWVWATFDMVGEVQGGIQKQPKRTPKNNAYPYLRVANVMRGYLDLSEVYDIELFGDELEKLRLQARDLLIVEGNGSQNEIGRSALWKGEIVNCVHQNHIIRVRFSEVSTAYVSHYLNSPSGIAHMMSVAASTSGLYTLSTAKVKAIAFPLPPLAEQRRIVAEVERRLSVVAALEKTVDANLARAARLRQAILHRAFTGRLAAQDPSDEPAERLLERIRANRVGATLAVARTAVARKAVAPDAIVPKRTRAGRVRATGATRAGASPAPTAMRNRKRRGN